MVSGNNDAMRRSRYPDGASTPTSSQSRNWVALGIVDANCIVVGRGRSAAKSPIVWYLGETGPLSEGVQAGRKAFRIRYINSMEVRKKRHRGFKKRPRGFK